MSVARRVSATFVTALAISLAAVGVTAGALHYVRERVALDHALVAAAQAEAGAGLGTNPYAIETWTASAEGDRVPPRIYARVVASGDVLVKDMGRNRLALVPVGSGTETKVLAAMAPKVTVARSVGALAGVWFVSSAAILLASALAVRRAVVRAFAPIERARDDVTRVMALGQRERVSTDAPPEVAALLSAINALLDRLDAAHALQVRFVADAAHELRTPVTALLGQLDVALRKERSAAELRATLESVHDDVAHVRRVVEALTALARVDAGEVEAHKEVVRAADLAHTVLDAERTDLDAQGCRVVLHADDDPEIRVHRVLLELALGNLLRNAAKHAPGSEVTFTVRREAERAVFEVRDTGPGISPADAESVFERFTRGAQARDRNPQGLGLGLPLAREVARRHGGDCVLRPIPAGGTKAVLDVPA